MFSYALKSGGNLRGIFISIDKRTDCCQRKFLHLLSAFPDFLSPFHLVCLCLFLLSSFFSFSVCTSIRWFTMENFRGSNEKRKSCTRKRSEPWTRKLEFSSFPSIPPPFQGSHWPLGLLTAPHKEAQN